VPARRVGRRANRRVPLCKIFSNPLEPHARRDRIVSALVRNLHKSSRTAPSIEKGLFLYGFAQTVFPPSDEGRLPHSVREMSRSDRGRPPPSAGGFCRKAKDGGRDRAERGTNRRFPLYRFSTNPLEPYRVGRGLAPAARAVSAM